MKLLDGVKVVEFCSVAAGPFCAMLLADLGADVIKVEHPGGGDSMREWPPITDGYSENFASLNRNKRSVTLNLKDPLDAELARQLACDADIIVENNRPGVMRRLGLDYETLSAQSPGLVYCSISAFGQQGPRSTEGGFDLTLQAMSGVMSVTGEPGGAPVKSGVPLTDFATGLYGAMAAIAALRQAEQTGQGSHVDVPMFGASLAIAALQTSEYFGSGKDPVKLGSAHPRNAPYQAFKVQDGYIAFAAGNDKLWKSTCTAIGREDLADAERFSSTRLRCANQAELVEIIEAAFADTSVDEALRRLREAAVPCSPINTYSQALADEQVAHMGWVQPLELPGGHMTKTFVSPLTIGGVGGTVRRSPPRLGEHNAELLNPLREKQAQVAG
ncbi:CaiB/BaiF CoA transferase family protein [Sphingobium sp. B11D3D]|uniref:CaiB/BaiF CoA transferase family protein n=1 Tax=Sphingobium sp. B11D3D TaxID=2940576 RepID=UPI002224009F|nr:CoA transferase [Sphingobium sp. B11D3D]MCW2370078.1 crotonobetainyl-CoA:carnitine CoA-transferase CaiB-like acyl-CoA transferase [Sphingobium sp. B11D3D]